MTSSAPADHSLDAVFHALADPTRRALVKRLAEGQAMVTELAEPFEMTLAAVSKHLRVLESANLVQREVNGRIHRCTLIGGPMREADRWLQDYSAFWAGTLDRFSDYVKKEQP